MKQYPKNKDNHTYNLSGLRFGMLTAVEVSGSDKWGSSLWLCLCDCGNSKVINGRYLRLGDTRSCGCLRRSNSSLSSSGRFIHGLSGTVEYSAWSQMLDRCYNKNCNWYHRYGGRGITVCDRWRSVEKFIEDIGIRPSANHSLDRIDNDKGYYPENCKWSTKEEQANNTSKNRMITYKGETLSVSMMAKKHGVDIQKAFRGVYKGLDAGEIFGSEK